MAHNNRRIATSLSFDIEPVCPAAVALLLGRVVHPLHAERAQSLPGERPDQVLQVRLVDHGGGRAGVAAGQAGHQLRRALQHRGGARQQREAQPAHPTGQQGDAGQGECDALKKRVGAECRGVLEFWKDVKAMRV